MAKHNNMIFRETRKKQLEDKKRTLVKTWLNQPARKLRRRKARMAKAIKISPRPTGGLLRPAVRACTAKYNMRLRTGRGFTLEELKAAGIPAVKARSIGIAVDHRRRNATAETMSLNVQRLKEYQSKLVVFPKNAKKPTTNDSSAEEIAKAKQLKGRNVMPVKKQVKKVQARAIKDDERVASAYSKLRHERSAKKLKGIREKRAKERAEAEAMTKKK
eukprot:TRINITY_DN15079_c0_g1_i1.p2 TRINITY_DN15079_c0_g1~~TRINITY_DN15079_c0_g1_i1.p2  ORF type:complete len:217 (+),score=63.81 TRINITY_DN15079_c0_g1_i1:29-679(+)